MRIFVFLLPVMSGMSACAPSDARLSTTQGAADAIVPLPARTEPNQMCGVESYRAIEDAACGVALYSVKESAACGVASYNQRTSMACPGSIPAGDANVVTTGGCSRGDAPGPGGCPGGYGDRGVAQATTECSSHAGHGDPIVRTVVTRQERACRRDDAPQTCRLPQFGVERFNACRHASHGVERYNTCALPQFGVAAYKSCTFYLTPEQAREYVKSHAQLVDYMGQQMLTGRGHFHAFKSDQNGLGCAIRKYGDDPLYADVVADLKTIFSVTFGVEYATAHLDCGGGGVVDIDSVDASTCPDADVTNVCKAWRTYYGAKRWLTVTQTDAAHLLGDIGAMSAPDVRALVSGLNDSVTARLK
jgi:hypothetical protein